jgi:tetratricopeptide (TPR) repeat protein
MRKIFVAGYLMLSVAGGGCSSGGGWFGMGGNRQTSVSAVQAVNSKQARSMNAARSEFESTEDPPLNAETHFAAAQLNETQGNVPAAIEQYEQCLSAKPADESPVLYRLGVLYTQVRQYPQAISAWNRYIVATQHAPVGYSNLGYCQELSGDRGAAEISYRTGIERDPKSQPCRVNYGLMLARAGRIEEATTQFSAVLSPAEVHYNLASVYQQQGKRDQARSEYRQALKVDPAFSDAKQRLAALDKD